MTLFSALVTHLVWVTTSVLISLRSSGGARLQDQALATLRGQVIEIISGTVFVFLGLAAFDRLEEGGTFRRQLFETTSSLSLWLGVRSPWEPFPGGNRRALETLDFEGK